MNGARLRAAIDAAYSAAVLGAIVVILRREITPKLAKLRADMRARAIEVRAEGQRIERQAAFLAYLHERGIEPSRYDLGMES